MMAGNTDFKISSLNVNGLGDFQKRKDVFGYLRNLKHDIYFLQETHIKTDQENYTRSTWGYETWVAGANSNSKGVAILFSPSFQYKVHNVHRDPNGCFLALDVTILEIRTTLINIYGPSDKDKPEFIDEIMTVINEYQNEIIIAGGDWNCILNMKIDSRNYTSTINRPKMRTKIKDFIADNNLIDVFRELHPDKRAYTWRRPNTIKQGRLDYFLVSEDLHGQIKNSLISPGYRSDHSLVTITFRKNELKRDRQFWKFNNSLLKDRGYIEQTKELINTVKRQYAVLVYDIDNLNNVATEDIQFTISDQLFFETLLMEIRGKTISYSTYKKKKEEKEEEELKKTISDLEADLENLETNMNKLELCKNELQLLRVKKLMELL